MTTNSGRPPVAVVTGAARGLGEHVARRLAAKGFQVALVGHEPDRLEQVAAACGGGARWWQADVTDSAALADVAAQVGEQLGGADVVVANAGIALGSSLLLADGAAYDRVLEVNLLGSIRTARAFLPQLVSRRGYLLQIASLAALVPTPMMSSYGASKAGVEAYAHAVMPELAAHGVGVGIAYLSWTDTDMVRGADEQSRALARQRSALPPPFNRTYPIDQAADTLVRGILARKRHIYAPGWLRLVPPLRGLLPLVTASGAQRVGRTEQALQAETDGPIGGHSGAGGLADDAARSPSDPR